MRLTLRQQWRFRALNSCLGIMDIKTGATIVVLFALLNKVAGIYGLIAIFNGGTLAQLSMYIYSVVALAAFTWGMKAITEENPKNAFYFAHIFLGDHLLNTIWTVFFAISWWYYNPHDGKRVANSAAQKEMMGTDGPVMTDEERTTAAQLIWNKEKGTAAMVLFIGWALKLYFAALLYSYALHLRRGSYRSIAANSSTDIAGSNRSAQGGNDEYDGLEDNDEFYQMPLRNGVPYGSAPNFPNSPGPSSRTRRANGTASPLPRSSSRIMRDLETPIEAVLWDEEEEEVEASGRLPTMSQIDLTTESGGEQDDIERGDISGLTTKPRITRKMTA